nr:protein root UVB sensitive 3 isoform X4 [Ipomoea trifida]
MMLSTQALLSAIGVGEKSATVIGATFQWFLRDLSGMVGGILFTHLFHRNVDGPSLSCTSIGIFVHSMSGELIKII